MTKVRSVSPRFPVADLKAAIAFYRDVLGFTVGATWPDDAPKFALFAHGEATLQFFVPDSEAGLPSHTAAPNDRPMISLDVSDARALHAQLLQQGVSIEWGPQVYWYGRREFAIRDPNGYLVILSEETGDPVTDPDDK